MDAFVANNPLVCVVTGMEHSGTTLASQVLNGHPNVASGVECGLLLSNITDFASVSPFYEWLCGQNWSWGLRPEDRRKLLEARSFSEAYYLLGKFKGRGHDDERLRKLFTESDLIFDKTPRYVYTLTRIVQKVDRPFIVTVKDPIEAIESARKRGTNIPRFLRRYGHAIAQIAGAVESRPQQVMIVRYQSLAGSFSSTVTAIAAFVGLDDVTLSLERYNDRFGRLVQSNNSFRPDRVEYVPPAVDLSRKERLALDKMRARYEKQLKVIDRVSV